MSLQNLVGVSLDPIQPAKATVVEAIAQASALLRWTQDWLKRNHPELV